ncbi:MAG: hypothetical protein IJJ70_04245 [Treponema sp.]|nr:hypothetical protein [Treponema sp.]MBR0486902.1 hypothetical protein [Treponema sp.]
MKKLLSVSAAALTLLASAALISCGTEGDDYSGATDTVLTLTSPNVSATAYPGVNYITWEPIAGAESFELYRTTDGESSSTKIAAVSGTKTEYADIAASDHVLSDGKSYKYTVIAVSSSDPSRAVYVKSSQASVSVTAIVPTAGTNVADFTDSYSKNYFKKLDSTNLSKYVTVSTTDGYVYAEYPATAGFKYGVTILNANEYEALGNDAVNNATTANYKADYKAEFKNASAITSAGNYVAVAKIDSVSTLYTPTYVKLGSVEVKNIGESSATSDTSATWIAENKARISWTPAQLKATGENTATTNYKVYRSSDADNTWVSVEGSVVSGEETDASANVSVVYYIDDSLSDNTIAYTYHVVHTDGTYYGAYSAGNNEASLAKFAYAQTGAPTVTASPYNNDATGVADTIKIVATKNSTDYNQTLAVSYVKLADDADGNAVMTYAADSFTSITLANNNGEEDSYTVYIKDAAAGTYLIKVTASETGKTDNTVYTLVTVDSADVSVSGISANFGKFTISGNEVKAVTIVDTEINDTTDALSNYTYGLYKVVITETDKYNDIVKVETTAVNDNITLAKVTSAAGDKLYEDYSLTPGFYSAAVSVDYSTGSLITNSFYVKKALASDASVYAKKTVTGTYN